MNKHYSQGSMGFTLLFSCLLLALLVSLAAHLLTEQYGQHAAELRLFQLRQLSGSAIVHLAQQSTLDQGTHRLGAVTLYPGKLPATLDYSYTISSDECFHQLFTQAATTRERARLGQTRFTPSRELQELAQSYAVIASYGITNAKYLPQGTLYTSSGNFQVPALELLGQGAKSSLDLEDLHNNGSNGSFVLINGTSSQTRLTYAAAKPLTKGSLLLASRGNITLDKNFHASDRLVLLTDRGTITLEDNVTLDAALIISGGRLTIGKNCRIKGIIMVRDRLVLQGSCNITQDANVVAPLVSPITSYVN